MIRRLIGPAFTVRPGDPEAWVRAGEAAVQPAAPAPTARLTVDVTPGLRGRIKIEAVRRGVTMGEMLRDLLEDAFPEHAEDKP